MNDKVGEKNKVNTVRIPWGKIRSLSFPVLVYGPPGSGKTTLMRQISEKVDKLPDMKMPVFESELSGRHLGGPSYSETYTSIQGVFDSYANALANKNEKFVAISHIPKKPKTQHGLVVYKSAIMLERLIEREGMPQQYEADADWMSAEGWTLDEMSDTYSFWSPTSEADLNG